MQITPITTIFACDYGQASQELPTIQHGAFTYALVEGLKQFTLPINLETYLQRRVRELNIQAERWVEQKPHIECAQAAQAVRPLLPLPPSSQELDIVLSRAKQEPNLEQVKVWLQSVIDLAPLLPQREEAKRELERLQEKQGLESKLQPESKPFSAMPQSGSKPTKAAKPTLATFRFEVVTIAAIDRGFLGFGAPKVELASYWERAKHLAEVLDNGVVLEMVSLPGGKFQMGTPVDEKVFSAFMVETLHRPRPVTVKPFFMGKYAVTQAQWRAVAALPKLKHELKPDPSYFKGNSRPVEQVSWHEAVEFCDRLSAQTGRKYRLSSEAEWEYACRAGTTTPFHFGKSITTDLANYKGTGAIILGEHVSGAYGDGPYGVDRKQTTDVGSFSPNAFGLYDMHGNVCEWCLDCLHNDDTYEGMPSDGGAWTTGEVSGVYSLRGGSWNQAPVHCRSACSFHNSVDARDFNLGFRVVCSVLSMIL